MPAVFVPGNAGLPDDAFTWRSSGGPANIALYSQSLVVAGDYCVLLGADLTMSGAAGIGPCFVALALGSKVFYYDSQSTGEGQGITFAWRGQLPLKKADVVSWGAQQPATDLVVSSIMWGWASPRVMLNPGP